jgi:hypothetical protein
LQYRAEDEISGLGNRTRRDAAGWYVLPFQGEGLISKPKP